MRKIIIISLLYCSLSSCEVYDMIKGNGISKIKVGMTQSEVSSNMGLSIYYDEIVAKTSNTETVRYRDMNTYYYFVFEDGKLSSWWKEARK